MTASYRKKLIEVALPLRAINEESARRKRKAPAGYPTTIHKWWAQRPIAACRAVLFSSLVDDPDSDPQFRKPDGSVDEDAAGTKRAELFDLIEELVLWENSTDARVINAARAEIARCVVSRQIELGELKKNEIIFGERNGQLHPNGPLSGDGITAWEVLLRKAAPQVVDAFLAEHAPPVLDPFAGGGSIPLEAQRLGLRVIASDLNPIPVLINKALIEVPPQFANQAPVNADWQSKSKAEKAATVWQGTQGLVQDLRHYGQWIEEEAEGRLKSLYPKITITAEMVERRPDLSQYLDQTLPVVAWLWARTVPSPNPACRGASVPLIRSFALSTKKGKEAWVNAIVDPQQNEYHFEVHTRLSHPAGSPAKPIMGRQGGKCILSGVAMPFAHIRANAKAGHLGERLMAIVAEGRSGRIYLSPTDHQEKLAHSAHPKWFPDAEMPEKHRNFQPPVYGISNLSQLFTKRQLVALTTFSTLIQEARQHVLRDAQNTFSPTGGTLSESRNAQAAAYADALALLLACAFARAVDYNSAFASWRPKDNAMRSTLGKQAIPMVWDFAEANPLEKSSAGFADCIRVIAKCVELLPANLPASVTQLDATSLRETEDKVMICTDPPYYDNISYADLSDFFYVWHRHCLGSVFPSLFSTVVTPKAQELIASPYRHDGDKEAAKRFFESGLGKAFHRMHACCNADLPIQVFYAFKQSESDAEDEESDEELNAIESVASTGWETMLEGLIDARFAITGTWPMRTEGDNRQVGHGANALASSIVLVCRPRPDNASLATRKEFITALRRELPDALRNLQRGNIAPVDLAQAAIGPGMAVFTRYAKVIESDGAPMTVRTALGLINQSLDEVLAEQEGEFDGDTRWALAWFEQFGMDDGPFGDAETLSKAKNTAINGLVEAGIITARAGKVRLVKRAELPADWNPAADKRLTVWEITQHLIHRLDQQGETGAATLVGQLGSVAEISRDLAYRLYSTCERKKWAQDALAYNSLVVAWPELTKLALANRTQGKPAKQSELF